MSREILAEIVATGSEMMLGQQVDTNSAWLSEILNSVGIQVVRHTAVGDDLPRIVEAYERAWQDHHIIISTGGLGPTEDDLTRPAAAQAFGRELEYHEELAEELRALFVASGYTLTENNLRQVWLPRGSLLIPNHNGTAPGFALADENHLMAFLPGVPMEMKRMVEEWLLPQLRERFPSEKGIIKTVVMKTAGLGESHVDSLMGDLMGSDQNPAVGLLAGPDMVRVVVAGRGADEAEAEAVLAPVLAELEKRLAGYVFGYGESTLPQAVAGLLKKNGLRLAIFDAATRGRLSGALSPVLETENWAGARDLPWQKSLADAADIIKRYERPDSLENAEPGEAIRLICTFQPDSEAPAPGRVKLLVECAVQADRINGGRPVLEHLQVGGTPDRALSRAASFGIFHLWRVLRSLEN